MAGIDHRVISAYKPNSNGLVERHQKSEAPSVMLSAIKEKLNNLVRNKGTNDPFPRQDSERISSFTEIRRSYVQFSDSVKDGGPGLGGLGSPCNDDDNN